MKCSARQVIERRSRVKEVEELVGNEAKAVEEEVHEEVRKIITKDIEEVDETASEEQVKKGVEDSVIVEGVGEEVTEE